MSSYSYHVDNADFDYGYKIIYRFIFVTSGASAPDPETGHSVVLVGTVGSNDMYIEYKQA